MRWVYLVTAGVALLFVIQAIAVPIYVPILFDQPWQQQYSVITVLCLAALSSIFVDTHCNLLRAQGAYTHELCTRLACLFISTTCLLSFQIDTPENLAFVILASSIAWLLVMLPWHSIIPYLSISKSPSIRSQTNE